MKSLTIEKIQAYREDTFRLRTGRKVTSLEQAIEFVNERGYIFFWPIREVTFPSLWVATAGDRPVADAHDDPGHVTWGWKDELLGKRRWYYAKVLRKRATIISLEIAPYFYALSENYGSIEDDYLTLYEQGLLSLEGRAIYEAILKEGPLHTIDLRKAARLSSRESDYRFNRALVDLQVDFKLLPTGVAKAGAWNYAFIYDIAARHFPDLPDQAQKIGERAARKKLVELFLRSTGAALEGELRKMFPWRPRQMDKTIAALEEEGVICRTAVENQPGAWLALRELS